MSNSHQGMIRITLFTSSQGDLGEGIPNVTGGLLYNNSMTIHRVLVLQYLKCEGEVTYVLQKLWERVV